MKITRLRQERKKHGWTLAYVAEQTGTTNQAISLIETGKNKPSYDVLVKLENLFELNHRNLFKTVTDETNE